MQVKNLLERLGDLEARVAGNAAAAKRNQDDVNPRWSRIDGLSGSNALQSADLARIEATLSDVSGHCSWFPLWDTRIHSAFSVGREGERTIGDGEKEGRIVRETGVGWERGSELAIERRGQ